MSEMKSQLICSDYTNMNMKMNIYISEGKAIFQTNDKYYSAELAKLLKCKKYSFNLKIFYILSSTLMVSYDFYDDK